VDRNAVQTLSRLNRSCDGKEDVVVVDFTNNARAILKAFVMYRKGTPFEPGQPDEKQCLRLYKKILAERVFTRKDASAMVKLLAMGADAQVQFAVKGLRNRFDEKITDPEQRKAFIYLLARFVKSFHFLTCFFTYPLDMREFAAFAQYVGPQLIKAGNISELMKEIRATEVVKSSVKYQGKVRKAGVVKLTPSKRYKGGGPPPKMISVQDMIQEIGERFHISAKEALYIKEVTKEKTRDPDIKATVVAHKDDRGFLEGAFQGQVNGQIQSAYAERGLYDELADVRYTDPGAIFDIMALTVIEQHLSLAA
jgi:type I restriction enzyme R subunit